MNRSIAHEYSAPRIVAALSLVVGLGACSSPPSEAPAATSREAPSTGSAAPSPAAGGRETVVLNPQNTTIAFTAAKVTASHPGGFREHAGTIELDPQRPEASSLSIVIQTASIFTDSDRLTNHLKTDDFFDVATHPTATFTSTAIRAGGEGNATHTITGTLAMHGVTRELTFPATVTVAPDRVRADAAFSINRREWNLVYPGMPDDLIRDEVDLRLTVDAPRTPR
jgi:polyisoprenoid-binding protein YceI